MSDNPVYDIVTAALTKAGVTWRQGAAPERLDISLHGTGVSIDCPPQWREKAIRRMEHHPHAILIQGEKAAAVFANLITKGKTDGG